VDPVLRPLFNATYSDAFFQKFLKRFEERSGGETPFRVAETPLLMTHALRDRLAKYASEIVEQLSSPEKFAVLKQAIPARYDVPGMDPLPNCVQVDFALTRNAAGELDGKVVELQAFPSLYSLMTVMSDTWAESLNTVPGMGGDWSWSIKRDHASALQLMRDTIVAGEDPDEVVLVDLEPENQKTRPDFVATRKLFGVDSVCVSKLVKQGRQLFREKNGKLVRVRRIYNRMVFDELEIKQVQPPFRWNEELDVTWCSHPNWYWVWSKFALPYIQHQAMPRTWFLNELPEIPAELSRYVLKPLFSFAGTGVVIDVTPQDIARVPVEQRHHWVLQEKIEYASAITTPEGQGVKAEVRVMLIRPPAATSLEPLMCLVRLSRGKMIGVDHNKDLSWVGGSVGMWRR
jgi:hypothetical protein